MIEENGPEAQVQKLLLMNYIGCDRLFNIQHFSWIEDPLRIKRSLEERH